MTDWMNKVFQNVFLAVFLLLMGCSTLPPKNMDNLCEIFFEKDDWYDADTLVTKDNKGNIEETTIRYKDMVNWIIRTKRNGA